ncbi:uncharacterized protein BX663DRAFT_559709 [Cokeromyces recurvatus]|uniref:uncharacterized protein n=1 Tax=Cokeromyces recurvatus TaxID=90255 RepID=UPI00221E87E0|nr:uncharacterized protein BX663DRAFT_559709 [Cokeromyces recurvatus]KAI7904731.1 hypothetical protein BX663DRAFT_559709 [Cokeromyces recurvatus]
MTQQYTLGLLSLSIKDEAVKAIHQNQQLEIIFEKQVKLTVDTVSTHQIELLQTKNWIINEQQPIYGLILEGSNAIEDWLTIINGLSKKKNSLLHGSATVNDAQQEIEWFKNYMVASKSEKVKKNMQNKKYTTKKDTTTITDNSQKKKKRIELRSSNIGQIEPRHMSTTTLVAKRSSTHPKIPNITSTRNANNLLEKKSNTRSNITKSSLKESNNKNKIDNNNNTRVSEERNRKRRGRGNSFSTYSSQSTTMTTTAAPSKKFLTAKGGISKNTLPVSILTGRTKKPNRLTTEKRSGIIPSSDEEEEEKDQTVNSKNSIQIAKEEDLVIQSIVDKELKKQLNPSNEDKVVEETDEKVTILNDVQKEEKEEAEEDILIIDQVQNQQTQLYSFSTTTCSTLTTTIVDEHDAEVAATISKSMAANIDDLFALPLLTSTTRTSGRSSSSFSSTLPRPETPDIVVDQLRLHFESMATSSVPQSPLPNSKINRKSAISPEFAARIKEMKPRNPVGTRVKNMVDFFMDENLHKWEF